MKPLTYEQKSAVAFGLGSFLFMVIVLGRACAPTPKPTDEQRREDTRLLREAHERLAAEREAELQALEQEQQIESQRPEAEQIEREKAVDAKHVEPKRRKRRKHHKQQETLDAKASKEAKVDAESEPDVGGASMEEWEQAVRNMPKVSKPASGSCCKVCSDSRPCGNSCIPYGRQCHKSSGCAC